MAMTDAAIGRLPKPERDQLIAGHDGSRTFTHCPHTEERDALELRADQSGAGPPGSDKTVWTRRTRSSIAKGLLINSGIGSMPLSCRSAES